MCDEPTQLASDPTTKPVEVKVATVKTPVDTKPDSRASVPVQQKATRKTETHRGEFASRGGLEDGSDLNQVKTMRVVVTAYSAPCPVQGTGSRTATGRLVWKVVDGVVTKEKAPGVAVDPNLIPLGSQVEIDGKLYLADDTGGAIKGHRIDLRLDSREEAINWGSRVKTIRVYPKVGKDNDSSDDT